MTGLAAGELLSAPGNALRELGLKWNSMNAVAGNAIAEALEVNKTLMMLDLGMNKIGQRPQGLEAKAEAPKPKKKAVETDETLLGAIGAAWAKAL